LASEALLDALARAWAHVRDLPDDDDALAALTPEQRRDAHDLAGRIADRVAATAASLVRDMALDGADLVDGTGLPDSMRPQPDGQDA